MNFPEIDIPEPIYPVLIHCGQVTLPPCDLHLVSSRELQVYVGEDLIDIVYLSPEQNVITGLCVPDDTAVTLELRDCHEDGSARFTSCLTCLAGYNFESENPGSNMTVLWDVKIHTTTDNAEYGFVLPEEVDESIVMCGFPDFNPSKEV